jgi:hypothetical protein
MGLYAVVGCSDPAPDPRFAAPEDVVRTLLAAYGVDGVPEQEIQRRMRERGQFDLRDEVTYRACFADYVGPADEGLAGYVFGALAARKDSLRVVRIGDRAHVFPVADDQSHMIVMTRADGVYRISLRDSVPQRVQAQLRDVHRRARAQAERLPPVPDL